MPHSGPHISSEQKTTVVALRFLSTHKHTYAVISQRLGIPKSTVANICKRYKERGTVENQHGGGKKPKMKESDHRYLKRLVKTSEANGEPRLTLNNITTMISNSRSGGSVSASTSSKSS